MNNQIVAPTVLLADDDPALLSVLSAGLSARGFAVTTAASGAVCLELLADETPDALVLDLGLSDLDGLEVIRRLRLWSAVPIIVLSADGSERRKVLALDLGADDYVTKPFSMPELAARLRVALRHSTNSGANDAGEVTELTVGNLVVDLLRREARVAGRNTDLTRKEFEIVALLARQPGRVLTHRSILSSVWGPDYGTETHYLRVYASQIRKKLGNEPETPRLVAEPGVGYRLNEA